MNKAKKKYYRPMIETKRIVLHLLNNSVFDLDSSLFAYQCYPNYCGCDDNPCNCNPSNCNCC